MEEIQYNSSDISRPSLLKSGLRVGNAVIGSMFLIIVAPATAWIASYLLTHVRHKSVNSATLIEND